MAHDVVRPSSPGDHEGSVERSSDELADAGWDVVTDGRDAATLSGSRRAGRRPCPATSPTRRTAGRWSRPPGSVDLLVNNAGGLGPSPLPGLADYPLDALADLFAVNVVAPLGLIQDGAAAPRRATRVIVDITSDASVEAYEGWGGYGSTKAALDHVGRVLAAEHPAIRVLTVDPGRHAHPDAPGRLPRRGHLRPAAAGGERAGILP